MAIGDPPQLIEDLQARNISTECPHCGDTVALIPAHKPINTSNHSYFVALCPNHKRRFCKPIFAVYQPLNDYIEERYPIPTFDAARMNKAIPEAIREDYAEGARCLYVDSNKAVVVMCRRVLEAVASDKLGTKAKDAKSNTLKLHALIDLLHAEGFITKDLKETAHEIRQFGNYGAHVQDDGLDKVRREEAKNAREVTWQFLYSIYVAPAKTEELRKARRGKGA
jgi:Domain of unknown function (DUF4145)